MFLNLFRYLFSLRKNAIYFERLDINGHVSTTFLARNSRRIICFTFSIILVLLLKKGFSSIFISYASTILSIFIGLFITAMIFSFDRFYFKIDFNIASAKEKLLNTQAFNYSKQFAFITGYNIVLALFTLMFISFSALFEDFMNKNPFEYHFIFSNFNEVAIFTFFNLLIIFLQRFLVLYWLACILYNTLFLVSSMVKFMTLKLNRTND
jgi:hypothetical protein